VTVDQLLRVTRERLPARARRVVSEGSLIQAAVLLPILDRGEAHIVFAKRTERVAHHRGQIAFPGGTVAPGDPSIAAAALRECEEEIGLPRTAVELLGALDDTETFATQFVITPFVGLITKPVAFQPDGREIEKVIEVPVAALLRAGTFRVEEWERDGVRRPVYFFDYEGETIWGATARILKQYLDLVREPPRGRPG
jgi:8-oxo-dGTP pyrophosphatase MutT (NUDIX family)